MLPGRRLNTAVMGSPHLSVGRLVHSLRLGRFALKGQLWASDTPGAGKLDR